MVHVAQLRIPLSILTWRSFLLKRQYAVAYVPGSFWDFPAPRFTAYRQHGFREVLPLAAWRRARRARPTIWFQAGGGRKVPPTEVKDQKNRLSIAPNPALNKIPNTQITAEITFCRRVFARARTTVRSVTNAMK